MANVATKRREISNFVIIHFFLGKEIALNSETHGARVHGTKTLKCILHISAHYTCYRRTLDGGHCFPFYNPPMQVKWRLAWVHAKKAAKSWIKVRRDFISLWEITLRRGNEGCQRLRDQEFFKDLILPEPQ